MMCTVKNYATFFSVINLRIKMNQEKIERLENPHFQFGEEGIYCSKDDLRSMAADYCTHNKENGFSEETKNAIFTEIHRIQALAFERRRQDSSLKQKEQSLSKAKKDLDSVFDKAILDTVRSQVRRSGENINLTARQAIIKEFELLSGLIPEDDDYEADLEKYIKNLELKETILKVADDLYNGCRT